MECEREKEEQAKGCNGGGGGDGGWRESGPSAAFWGFLTAARQAVNHAE